MLSIAGSDPSGGAGIQADIKTAAALGVYAMAVITAVTAQNTQGVRGFEAVSPAMLELQLRTLFADIRPDAVKIGMLPTAEHVAVTARVLRECEVGNVVVDPVLVATSGDALSAGDTVQAMLADLAPLATVLTPNLPETATLLSCPAPSSVAGMEEAAHALRALTGCRGVLVKGGHGEVADMITDVYVAPDNNQRFVHRRIDTQNTHGTGCTLSSAIASHIALGAAPDEAVARAIGWLQRALEQGARYHLGHGHGPVNHFVSK